MPQKQDSRKPYYHPIIYVRGFAATQGEIEETVADPYMGFNLGSTKSRKAWDGKVQRFYFESPLVRLMSDHDYEDVYVDGDDLMGAALSKEPVPYQCIVIYRYYDDVSQDFGSGQGGSPIEQFARGLDALILRLRDRVCANPDNNVTKDGFKCYLIAHSMGGLICRSFLQKYGSREAIEKVNKVFTYATPHNGIDMRIVRNIPGWLTFGDVNNFNREKIAEYLGLPPGDDVSVITPFSPDRIFNLVGTNARDYAVAAGLSSWAVGDASDGLVRIENATTHGPGAAGRQSPRAFVNRSHSGHYGIVNSEEGYQNLTRFLFGAVRADGILDINDITLPAEVEAEFNAGKHIKASYQFELAVSVRGGQWQMTRREARENSAIFRTYDQLFPGDDKTRRPPDRSQSPHLFSIFLDPEKSMANDKSVSFALELKALVPDYTVDGALFLKRHYEGGSIYNQMIVVTATPDPNALGKFRISYGFQDDGPGQAARLANTYPIGEVGDMPAGLAFDIPIAQQTRPGLQGTLRIEVRNWQ